MPHPLPPELKEATGGCAELRTIVAGRCDRWNSSSGAGDVMGGPSQHRVWLAFPGHHRCGLPVLDAANPAVAQHQDRDPSPLRDVLLRRLLGVYLAAALPEERHGDSGHRRRHRGERADVVAHPRCRRCLRQRPLVGVRGHRVARPSRILFASARHLEPPRAPRRLLCTGTCRVLYRALRHHRGVDGHAHGPARPALLGAWDPRHHSPPCRLSWGVGVPLGWQAGRL
mmetsp:Transcript_94818/g.210793  ORF Transcript_94818/g.210793 Transcript_94818/m.210793 type:complete len:227 (-) Transcript_94818:70-750(-)